MNVSLPNPAVELKKRSEPDSNMENMNLANVDNAHTLQEKKVNLGLKKRKILGEIGTEGRNEDEDVRVKGEKQQFQAKLANGLELEPEERDTKEGKEGESEESADSVEKSFFNGIMERQKQFLETRQLIKGQLGIF